MPELPDITVYIEALEQRVLGHVLERILIAGPSLLRTADPPISLAEGRKVAELRRVGKRIAFGLDPAASDPALRDGERLWLVLHLMIAGRLHWSDKRKVPDGRRVLAAFDFDNGSLTLTEAGTRKRASVHLVRGSAALKNLDPGGIDVMASSLEDFSRILTSSNHTLKRSLTDPHYFSGIGNAYSDEILHAARLSPVALTQRLKPEEIARLYQSTQKTLLEWIDRLRTESGLTSGGKSKFPEKVTAFRPEMAVHGRYGQPCPRCGTKVQRIRYASNETNYCPRCQTEGKLLADRSLSRLLREDWPKSLDELEERREDRRNRA
ncbi:MAG TPA: DNA-formamidopyrimidine glycosylase family protein [Candidatus Angelobacter sp.]|nr:DNA-formamidopyrimidine glycosylase family protein [Candidatus Angelobacter sp.]